MFSWKYFFKIVFLLPAPLSSSSTAENICCSLPYRLPMHTVDPTGHLLMALLPRLFMCPSCQCPCLTTGQPSQKTRKPACTLSSLSLFAQKTQYLRLLFTSAIQQMRSWCLWHTSTVDPTYHPFLASLLNSTLHPCLQSQQAFSVNIPG